MESKTRFQAALLCIDQSGSIRKVVDFFDKDLSILSKNLNNIKLKLVDDDHLQ